MKFGLDESLYLKPVNNFVKTNSSKDISRESSNRATSKTHVLMVCTGNICRSPYAEYKFRELLNDHNLSHISVTSAGLDTPGGWDPHELTVEESFNRGIDLKKHQSTEVTAELLERSDLILYMDHYHQKAFKNRFPDFVHKTTYLGAIGQIKGAPLVIDDPYGMTLSGFKKCYNEIDLCLEVLVEKLKS